MVGMRLVSNISNFYFPEEFTIIYEEQINPLLEKQYEILNKINQETKDWIVIHRPLARYLCNSIRNLFQERILDYRDHLYEEYVKNYYPNFHRNGNYSKEDTVAIVARTTKDVIGLDSIGISLTKVRILYLSVVLLFDLSHLS